MSLKGDKYETLEEINFRLANTVVLYEGKPVYITRVAVPEAEDKKEIARVFFVELPHKDLVGLAAPKRLGGLRLDVEDIKPQGKEQRKYLSSKNFDLAPFKMGYFNFDDRAVFVSRNPVRQNRQGLSRENTVFSNIKGNKDDGVDFGTMLKSQGFVDMVNGKYPDFKQVGDMLGNNENSSVAVSRCFAFHIDHDLEVLHLLHKGTRCGIAIKGDKALRIPPKFHFLRQEAEECRIPLA